LTSDGTVDTDGALRALDRLGGEVRTSVSASERTSPQFRRILGSLVRIVQFGALSRTAHDAESRAIAGLFERTHLEDPSGRQLDGVDASLIDRVLANDLEN